ncbi:MAG TPA: bifunctional DNA-formamidopyrimidine glycosylase/DNA-(apurinic or apyrimidinic site) lyase [bacterium]|jgi:formamidopyrimidine-DNA glycosylase|nr:bifunctional DNA-formamidopyrimidine glycosylase/DNA-(apurinic or apyrimidinic site) lyase [bacterium]
MPELPEVETIRRGLQAKVLGRTLVKADIRLKKQVRGLPAARFESQIKGRRIEALERRAKFLLFRLSGDKTLLVHLGMSGQLSYWDHSREDSGRFVVSPLTGLQRTPGQHAVDKHTHALLHLDRGDRVQYRDTRQFGYLRLLDTAQVEALPSLRRLGLEPLGPGFTFEAFERSLGARRGMLKALLLNQSAVVGLGNIYADEACFEAGLHPRQPVERLGPARRRALFAAVTAVLEQALGKGGTTFRDYRQPDGSHGLNQESLKAYGRAGLPCPRCGTPMRKILVSQRGTVFCPRCQRLK